MLRALPYGGDAQPVDTILNRLVITPGCLLALFLVLWGTHRSGCLLVYCSIPYVRRQSRDYPVRGAQGDERLPESRVDDRAYDLPSQITSEDGQGRE